MLKEKKLLLVLWDLFPRISFVGYCWRVLFCSNLFTFALQNVYFISFYFKTAKFLPSFFQEVVFISTKLKFILHYALLFIVRKIKAKVKSIAILKNEWSTKTYNIFETWLNEKTAFVKLFCITQMNNHKNHKEQYSQINWIIIQIKFVFEKTQII